MKRLFLVAVVGLFLSQTVLAQVGPPRTSTGEGEWSYGIGIYNANSSWKPYDVKVGISRFQLETSYGITDSVEFQARVGAANLVFNEVDLTTSVRDISSDGYGMFGGLGLHSELWRREKWSLGGFLQGNVYSPMENTVRTGVNEFKEIRFDPTVELTAALIGGYELGEEGKFGTVYFGPRVRFAYARADIRTFTFSSSPSVVDEIDALTVRAKGNLEAILGWEVPVGERWRLRLDGAAMNDGFGGGVALIRGGK